MKYKFSGRTIKDHQDFLKRNFKRSYLNKGGDAWYNSSDRLTIELFIQDCLEEYNSSSPTIEEELEVLDEKELLHFLINTVRKQNQKIDHLMEQLENLSK